MNKTKKFKSIVMKIINQINVITSEINTKIKKHQTLFVHTITIKINNEKKNFEFFFKFKFSPFIRN